MLELIALVAAKTIPFCAYSSFVAMLLCLFVFVPLGLWSRTRKVAGWALFYSSFVFGVTAWLRGYLATYVLWGWVLTLVGLMILGVGVVPMGIVAFGVRGEWWQVFELVLATVSAFGSRYLGIFLLEKAEARPAAPP